MQTYSNALEKELTIDQLNEAVRLLEEAKSSNEVLRQEFGKVLAFLARKTDINILTSTFVPEGTILVGTGTDHYKTNLK